MKDIKQYTCTLDQAKKLKDIGVYQDSFHYYCPIELPVCGNNILYGIEFMPKYPSHLSYSAFTSQELAELIDEVVLELGSQWKQDKQLIVKSYYFIFYLDGLVIKEIKSKSEAQARAEFLINLLVKHG